MSAKTRIAQLEEAMLPTDGACAVCGATAQQRAVIYLPRKEGDEAKPGDRDKCHVCGRLKPLRYYDGEEPPI